MIDMIERLKRWLGYQTRQRRRLKMVIREMTFMEEQPTEYKGKSSFVVGVGRSGTHLMAKIMNKSQDISGFHLDDVGNTVGDSFLVFCKWYDLPIDDGGLVESRKALVSKICRDNKRYFESNPYLSFAISILHQRLKSKFIFITRNPSDVVNSHYVKGWYKDDTCRYNSSIPLGFQYHFERPNHFFGRIRPRTKRELERWLELSRIGKISWMWNVWNLHIVSQLEEIPSDSYMFLKLGDLNYEKYQEIHEFVGSVDKLSKAEFNRICASRPGSGPEQRSTDDWSEREEEEFLEETRPAREVLGYS